MTITQHQISSIDGREETVSDCDDASDYDESDYDEEDDNDDDNDDDVVWLLAL